MKIGIIGEGETEFHCLPTLVASLNHTVVRVHNLHGVGCDQEWDKVVCHRFYPYVRSFAKMSSSNRPDKILIVVDRERRRQCCPELSKNAMQRLELLLKNENLAIPVAVVIANPTFECWLLANPHILDNSPLFKKKISLEIGGQTDGKNLQIIIKKNLKPNKKWDKRVYGKMLAKQLNLKDQSVLKRSRSLRKFVKEIDNQDIEN